MSIVALTRLGLLTEGVVCYMHELAVAVDAWGLALNEAGTRALVTSAWTNTVTLVDISAEGLKKCAEVTVGREPRGVVFMSDSVAYVNHLAGSELTKLRLSGSCDAQGISEAKAIVVAPSPARSPEGKVCLLLLGIRLRFRPMPSACLSRGMPWARGLMSRGLDRQQSMYCSCRRTSPRLPCIWPVRPG